MRILFLELKRVCKTRMTWISALAAILLSVLMSLSVISYAQHTNVDGSGQETKITGMEAIRSNKKQMKPYEGEITVEKLRQALTIFQGVYRQYGKEIPVEVIHEKLSPIDPFLSMIYDVYPESGNYYESLSKVDPDYLANFYTDRTKSIKNQLSVKYSGNSGVLSTAISLNERVKTPFVFVQGYTRDAADNLAVLISFLVLICAVIVSPIFAAEYQSGSDDVLRCTRYGKVRLAVTKLFAACLTVLAVFAVCTGIFVLVVNTAYGWDSLRTWVQVLFSALSFVPLTVGQAQGATVFAGFLTLLAAALFSLFLSAKLQNPTSALILTVGFCLLPTVLHSAVSGNLIDLLICLLPSGGAGLNTGSFYYQLSGITFLRIGPFSVWTPYLMLGAAMVEIPLFFLLAVRAYCRHQAG